MLTTIRHYHPTSVSLNEISSVRDLLHQQPAVFELLSQSVIKVTCFDLVAITPFTGMLMKPHDSNVVSPSRRVQLCTTVSRAR